jgi:hypothetical protein
MAQITIYIDDKALAQIKVAAKAQKVSQSQWVADAIRLRIKREWPDAVRALAGVWPDFPSGKEIRDRNTADIVRERL